MLACRVQYVENTGIGIAARANFARRKATSNSALWPTTTIPCSAVPILTARSVNRGAPARSASVIPCTWVAPAGRSGWRRQTH